MIRLPRPSFGFRAHLYALMAAALVPALLLGSIAVWEALRSYQGAFQARLHDTAHALALALDSELDSHVTALLTLADAYPAAQRPDELAAFERQAERTNKGLGTMGITLHGADRDVRMRSGATPTARRPPAEPGRADPNAAVERAFSTRQPAVGNLAPTEFSSEPSVTVVVPVIRDGEAVAAVAATVGPDRLSRVLARWRASQGGYVGVSDAASITVARSDSPHGAAQGKKLALPARWVAGPGHGGIHRVVTPDGIDRIVALYGLSVAPGWTVAVAEPWIIYQHTWQVPFDTLVMGGGAALLGGLGVALLLTRRLSGPVAGLAAEAARVADAAGEEVEGEAGGGAIRIDPERFAVAEYTILATALARADAVLRQRRQAERAAVTALAESEARLRTLADNLPDGLVFQAVQAPDGDAASWRLVHVSNGVERLHGLTAASVQAEPPLLFRRIRGAAHRARFLREVERAAAALDTFRIDLPFRAPTGGEPRWSRLSAAPRRLPDGGILWDGIEVDITAAKAAEVALRQAEERFRSLFEAAPFSITILDPKNFAVLAFNDRACGDLGYTREEFARLTVMDIDPLSDMAAIRRRARAHVLRPGIQEFECQHRGKDGELRDVLVRACGIVLDGREVTYTAHHDITERKAAEAALRAREAEFRAIFETSAAGMTEVDLRTDRYLRVNRRFCELVGRTEAELTGGLGPADIHHPDERGRPSGAAAAGASPDGRFEGERRFVRPDGAVVWVRGSAAVAARDAAGRPVRVANVMYDITAQKQADELQNLLMREVDHRARNALAVVQAMLRLAPADGPEARRFAATLGGRVAAMARAHTLLSRDRWAGAELRELAELEFAPYAGTGEERVRLEGPAALLVPEAAQPVGMVLHELATNAVKYGALSRPEGRVTLAWRFAAGVPAGAKAGDLLVEWRESGGPALTARPSRAGFGTRLVAGTVRQLGGEAALDWAADGLRCSFTIPANRLQAAATAAARAAAAAEAEAIGEPQVIAFLTAPAA